LFNLISGVVLLIGSAGAGLLWDGIAPSAPFYAGAAVATVGVLSTFALPTGGAGHRA